MKHIHDEMLKDEKYTKSNCFLFVIICYAMDDGHLMDRYCNPAFKLDELAEKVCKVDSLRKKPKIILIEEYARGRVKLSYLYEYLYRPVGFATAIYFCFYWVHKDWGCCTTQEKSQL